MGDAPRISFLPSPGPRSEGTRWLLTAAALVVIVAGLKAAEALLVPLVFASFLALLSAPSVMWLESRRFPPWAAVAVVSVGLLVVLGGAGTLLAGSVNDFVAAVPTYVQRLSRVLHHAGSLRFFGVNLSQFGLKEIVDPEGVVDIATSVAAQLASIVSDTALILLTTVFILLEVASLPRKVRRALGDPDADLSRYGELSREVQRYVVIKTYLSGGMAVLVGVFLWAMGIDFPLLWAVVAGLLNFIPNIGALLSAIPPVALALVQYGVGSALGTASAYTLAHLVIGNMLEPRLLGRNLGLSTLVVFLSLVFWGWLWGPLGMVLSVPLTMILKIVLESSSQFRPVAELMDQPLSYRGVSPDDSRPTWEQVLTRHSPDETLESPPP